MPVQRLVLTLTALVLVACSTVRGAPCTGSQACGDPYVCASTSSATLRRCLMPCGRDVGRTDTGATIMLGNLCSDGSVCLSSDVGPVCSFLGHIPFGDPCPMDGCDPATTVCDCEPGTICHAGFCRQVCSLARFDAAGLDATIADAPPEDPVDGGPDTGSLEDRVCGVRAMCVDGICEPLP